MTPTQKAQTIDRLAAQRDGYTKAGAGYAFGVVSRPEDPQDLTPEERRAQTVWGITEWDESTLGAQPTETEIATAELDHLKAAKLAELERARWDAEVAGITLTDNKAVRTDKETQAELGKALSMIATVNPALEIDWKFPNGEVVHMDATQIQQIAGAVFAHVQATRTAFKDKAALVAAATTAAELDAINW
jgi:hypothetical protein